MARRFGGPRIWAVVAVLALLAAACGGDDPEESASEDASEEVEATPDPSGSATDVAATEGAGGEEGGDDDGGRGPTLEALDTTPMTMGDAPILQTAEQAGRDGITFTPLPDTGYVRVPPARFEQAIAFYEATVEEPIETMDAAIWPADPYGTSGVAVFDADGDTDLDIYVTNGAGVPKTLLLNQLADSGSLDFVDGAVEAGVALVEAETAGVCHGDVDNDGDSDLFVVGNGSPDTLFVANGDGTFTTSTAIPGGPSIGGTTCAMGDVTGDGLLDIVVGHTFDHSNSLALVAEPFALNLPNVLLVQQPDGTFVDEAAARGMLGLAGVPEGTAGISWGVALVDYDADGDLDLIETDDQTTMLNANRGGVNRGLLQVLTNDGTGQFTAIDAGTLVPGTWMGTAWADFDCDTNLDMLAGNFGDYGLPVLGVPYDLGEYASRWLLGDGQGGFTDPGVGDVGATHFAWGGVAEDLDNDGDPDIAFQGGLDTSLLVDLSNPGTLLVNDECGADFTWDRDAFSVNHRSRLVTGTAAGDLDGDGFVDLVTVGSLVVPDPAPLFPMPTMYGLDTDGTGFFTSPFMPTDDGRFSYLGFEFAPGDLVIELNDGASGNAGLAVAPVGAVGLTDDAVVPRSGFGAIVTVIPEGGVPFTKPLQGGTGYLSADSPVINAGLGSGSKATVEVLWPGGVRNRYYDVAAGETLVAPEIPCSFTDTDTSETAYTACVSSALADLAAAGVIDDAAADDLLADALRARQEG